MNPDGLAKVTYLFGATAPDEETDAGPSGLAPLGATEPEVGPTQDSSGEGWYQENAAQGYSGDRAESRSGEQVDPDSPQDGDARTDSPNRPDRAWIRTEATPERSASRSSGPVFTEEPETTGSTKSAAPRTDLSALPNFIQNPVRERSESRGATGDANRHESRAEESVYEEEPAPPPSSKATAKTERRASNVSLNALARKGMSSREMERLLVRRELESDVIESEIARLEGAGLLDDKALAENLVRTLQDRKGLGKSAVQAELRRRQLDDTAITEAMADVDADDELERATEIAIKRAGQLSSYDHETAKRRLGAYLQRRGYGGSVLSAAMKAALDGGGGRATGPRFS